MSEAFLTTTSSEGLQPLGSAPQRSFELVSGAVRDRLGPEHGAIFGEPVASEHGDQIDWYAPVNGKVVALADLPQAEQQALRDRLGRLIGDIRAEAARLGESAAPEDQRLSEALANAIEIPGEGMIHAVRDCDGVLHPVLVHWAWVRDEQAAVRGVLTGMVPRPKAAPAPAPAAIAPARRGGASRWWLIWLIWLGWLLLAILLGIIVYLMVAPCGLRAGRLSYCPVEPGAPDASLSETRVIEDRIASLRHELALGVRNCRPTLAPVPDIPQPTEQEDQSLNRRLEQRGGARGQLNFVLEWGTKDDIDLHVTCPTGQPIFYLKRTNCGGTLDLDANVSPRTAISDPVENVVFETVAPGIYKVRVNLYSNRSKADQPVTLHVLRASGPSQTYSAILGPGRSDWVVNINISR